MFKGKNHEDFALGRLREKVNHNEMHRNTGNKWKFVLSGTNLNEIFHNLQQAGNT